MRLIFTPKCKLQRMLIIIMKKKNTQRAQYFIYGFGNVCFTRDSFKRVILSFEKLRVQNIDTI